MGPIADDHIQGRASIAVSTKVSVLMFHPAQDSSLRLWNTKTKVCVLIMNGDGGHRNEVLSIVSPKPTLSLLLSN